MAKKDNLISRLWKNLDNVNFYNFITAAKLRQLSVQAGLDDNKDLTLISSLINSAQTILEIGIGYGRVLQYLSSIHYTGQITGIEYCGNMLKESHIPSSLNFTKIHGDLSQLIINSKFDLILWMWSGICDFSQAEQPAIIAKLGNLLNENGSLVIDTIPGELIPVGSTNSNGREHFITLSELEIKSYCPSEKEITDYCAMAHLTKHTVIPYTTYNNRQRVSYIIKHATEA